MAGDLLRIGMRLTHSGALGGFFDRPAVVSAVDRATLRVCRIAGYRVRNTARKSLKVKPYAFQKQQQAVASMIKSGRLVYGAAAEGALRRGTAEPATVAKGSNEGSPPIAHEKEGLRRIYYSWDQSQRAMIVGPVQFSRKVSGKTIPEIHEFGANVFVGGQPARYPKRPFMRPALEKHIPELPDLWAGAVSGVK